MEVMKEQVVFNKAFDHIMEWEGGYVNDKDDRGGETKYGISQKAHPDVDIKNLTKEEAKKIYKHKYWDKLRLGLVDNEEIAIEIFDFGINAPMRTAVLALQRSVTLIGYPTKIDGKIGNNTIAAVNFASRYYSKALLAAFRGYEFLHYKNIVLRNPSQSKFIRNWLARI